MRYLEKLEDLRKIEYSWLQKSIKLGAITPFIFWGAPAFISVITFGASILMGIPLTCGIVLSALATFRILQEPIYNLPEFLLVLHKLKCPLIVSLLLSKNMNYKQMQLKASLHI